MRGFLSVSVLWRGVWIVTSLGMLEALIWMRMLLSSFGDERDERDDDVVEVAWEVWFSSLGTSFWVFLLFIITVTVMLCGDLVFGGILFVFL